MAKFKNDQLVTVTKRRSFLQTWQSMKQSESPAMLISIPIEVLALAYELRCEGCSWRNIATGLGLNPQTLERAIARLTEDRDICLNS